MVRSYKFWDSFSVKFVRRRTANDGGWEKVFLKKLWLALMGSKFSLMGRKFSELRVEYEVDGFGIKW